MPLLGGVFLIWIDVIARTVVVPTELLMGITSLCGAPFFLWAYRPGSKLQHRVTRPWLELADHPRTGVRAPRGAPSLARPPS